MDSQQLIKLDQKTICNILPQQPPFVYIDQVFDLIPGQSAKALKYIDPKDPIFSCHFPGRPIYPGIFLIEAVGQLAFITICHQANSGNVGYLGNVKNFTFRRVITPGMTVIIALEVILRLGNAAKVSARIFCGEKIMAHGEVSFTMDEGEGAAHL